jgi:hypothetical protein
VAAFAPLTTRGLAQRTADAIGEAREGKVSGLEHGAFSIGSSLGVGTAPHERTQPVGPQARMAVAAWVQAPRLCRSAHRAERRGQPPRSWSAITFPDVVSTPLAAPAARPSQPPALASACPRGQTPTSPARPSQRLSANVQRRLRRAVLLQLPLVVPAPGVAPSPRGLPMAASHGRVHDGRGRGHSHLRVSASVVTCGIMVIITDDDTAAIITTHDDPHRAGPLTAL